MDPRTAATRVPDPDAVEFVRFCYRRRRVGWPELYDEMCAVAGRGLFRGYGADDLAALGIGFSLFDMPAWPRWPARSSAEEQALRRRPVTVVTVTEDGLEVEASTAANAEPRSRLVRRSVAVIVPEATRRRRADPVLAPGLTEPARSPRSSGSPGCRRRLSDPHSSLTPRRAGPARASFDSGPALGAQARMRRLAISPSIWRSAST